MFEYPCPLLKAFFAIPAAEIDEDLERASDGLEHIRWELSHLMTRVEELALEDSVRISHLLLLQASAMSRRDDVPLEVKALYARMSAGMVAGEAQSSIFVSPRGKEVCRQLDAIEKRLGLTGEAGEDVPPEYRRLDDEIGAMMDDAYEEALLLALRRYRMEALAALYESDPGEFSLLADIGSRALNASPMPRTRDMIEAEDQAILKEHGPAALVRVRQRVEELRDEVSHIEHPWPMPDG